MGTRQLPCCLRSVLLGCSPARREDLAYELLPVSANYPVTYTATALRELVPVHAACVCPECDPSSFTPDAELTKERKGNPVARGRTTRVPTALLLLGFCASTFATVAAPRDDSASGPSPTLTQAAVQSAYAVYTDACGPDLAQVMQDGLAEYNFQNQLDVDIDDKDFQ
ncbi:hypothetical protein B0H17DRAFT_1123613 [Mycena rosella]|uniref:Uncharacterized protein n=1 Tax=Mycena rosella TaxID=1033263 RepID=A0AAD7H2K5_MYCRO|nr:hypothetical protein B0H17DRAFT_1123613 [Mycena rosella]